MLKSRDGQGPARAPRQPVAGRPGRLRVQGGTEILTYTDQAGAQVDIQAPRRSAGPGRELAQFTADVQVLLNAQPGRG